jgi:hypothetical protein
MSTPVNIQLGYKDSAWFTTNAAIVLLAGQIVYLDDQSGTYKLGDGVTALSALSFLGGGGGSQSLQDATDIGASTTNLIEVGGLDNTAKVITLNKNGASSTGSGIEFEESGSILGYIKTAVGSAFDFLHPLNVFYARIALNLLTVNRTYNLPDNSGTIALTSDISTDYTQSFAYTGSPFTLTVAPTFIYSIRTTSMVLDENDVNDVTISGTTLTVINPAFQADETLYIKYKA